MEAGGPFADMSSVAQRDRQDSANSLDLAARSASLFGALGGGGNGGAARFRTASNTAIRQQPDAAAAGLIERQVLMLPLPAARSHHTIVVYENYGNPWRRVCEPPKTQQLRKHLSSPDPTPHLTRGFWPAGLGQRSERRRVAEPVEARFPPRRQHRPVHGAGHRRERDGAAAAGPLQLRLDVAEPGAPAGTVPAGSGRAGRGAKRGYRCCQCWCAPYKSAESALASHRIMLARRRCNVRTVQAAKWLAIKWLASVVDPSGVAWRNRCLATRQLGSMHAEIPSHRARPELDDSPRQREQLHRTASSSGAAFLPPPSPDRGARRGHVAAAAAATAFGSPPLSRWVWIPSLCPSA